MIKHRAPLLLSLALCLASLLSACQTSAPDEPRSIHSPALTLWHAYRGDEASALLESLERFRAETGRAVRALQLPHQALNNKLQAAIPRGNGPDLWIGAHDRVGDYAEAGLIEPVGYWMTSSLVDQYFPRTLEALSYQGNLYGLPISFKTLALFYRTDLSPTPPKSLAELRSIALSLRERGVRWGLASPELDSLYFHAPWLHAFGGEATRLHERQSQEALLNSVSLISDLIRDGLIPPELNGALTASLFTSGQLAFVINGPWFKGDLEGTALPWSVAPLPTLSDQRALTPYLGVEGVFISSYTQDPTGAWALAQSITGERAARASLQRGGLVAQRALYQEEAPPALRAWRATFEAQLTNTRPLSNDPRMKRLWTPLKRLLSSVLFFQASPQESLTEALRAIEEQGS